MHAITHPLLAAALLFAATAFAADAPARIGDTAKGKTLVDAEGMTLYVFDKDTGGQSACSGPCAANWPPLLAAPGASGGGDYTVVARGDGTAQWAYKGRPLYTWKNDKRPGDITGDGFLNNTWHVATP
ncbi:COG4315 family predicted lipoprotein [Azospirillum sp. ST 5-10]|uniref:COG4315 family predicted lipoprotein n=1 Tax=unclassified Azospirillum TaxID=2630922 RepID=UPI003F49C65E